MFKMLKNKIRNYRLERVHTRSLAHKMEAELVDHGFLDRARGGQYKPKVQQRATKSLDGIRR